MDLHRAVGGLITGKVAGYELDRDYRSLIENGTIGGVTLFRDNARDLTQLVSLCDALHSAAGAEPFLVMVDQEGGAVQRFDEVLSPLPSPMALAGQQDLNAVRELMLSSARQLRMVGVNCVLAPVLDINSNPRNPIIGTRSFGADRRRVVELAQLVAAAYIAEGVLPVGKHFPGHGDTLQDSHLALAVVHADMKMVWDRELYPFRHCLGQLPSILVGHVWLTELDDEMLPASLSAKAINGLLRGELGYDGFLMSDDMPVMRAIVDHWGLEEAAVMAIQAGLDNLLISGTPDQIVSVHSALISAVASGQITEDQVASALRRRKTAIPPNHAAGASANANRMEVLEAEIAHGNALSSDLSACCIATVRGDVPAILQSSSDWVLVVPNHPRYKLDLLDHLSKRMPSSSAALHERRYTLKITSDEIAEVITFVGQRNCLFVTFRALLDDGQMQLGRALAERSGPTGLLVAADVPYEILELQAWHNAIATFDPSELAMESLARVIAGEVRPMGILGLAACPLVS